MIITIKREKRSEHATLSKVYVDGKYFCLALEDSVRDEKIPESTAIPAGQYNVQLRKAGGMHARYARLYPGLHRGMAQMMQVPNFEYVYIHIGNYFSDTAGCVLVGDYWKMKDGDYAVYGSTRTYLQLYVLMCKAWDNGEKVTVEIVSGPAFEEQCLS